MEYDIYKSAYCGGNGHDPIGSRQYSWKSHSFGTKYDLNTTFKKAEDYNNSRAKLGCSCMVEVKEVK